MLVIDEREKLLPHAKAGAIHDRPVDDPKILFREFCGELPEEFSGLYQMTPVVLYPDRSNRPWALRAESAGVGWA